MHIEGRKGHRWQAGTSNRGAVAVPFGPALVYSNGSVAGQLPELLLFLKVAVACVCNPCSETYTRP